MSKDLRAIISTGLEETGGFYDYWSNFNRQKVEGLKFYTDYKGLEETVSRPRTARLDAKRLLVVT